MLRLPAELRNKIYTFIGLSTRIEVFNMQEDYQTLFTHDIPPFLRTCKQIRSEATALIYAYATFDITRGDDISWVACCFEPKSCTTLQISWGLSRLVKIHGHLSFGKPAVCPLPNLERVEVMWAPQWRNEMIRGALRGWFNKEDLVVEFRDHEGMLTNW